MNEAAQVLLSIISTGCVVIITAMAIYVAVIVMKFNFVMDFLDKVAKIISAPIRGIVNKIANKLS